MSAPVMAPVSARALVSEAFFERLTKRVEKKHDVTSELAERITEQTLAYLATCATKPAGTPSLGMCPTVDLGWHAFLEYSKAYDEFFAAHGWRKVHHNPSDEPGETYESSRVVIPRTMEAMERAGYVVDRPLWATPSAAYSCGGDDSDGKPGDPNPCGDHG
ncbi:hypothetical protein ACQEVG_33040 [Streptomyces sp. CA-135486]|uniref:hypothetical protein n=1 Tax=Streptomyces sp. CA-135486 TaxID=3240049 RepID=UPI003D8AD5C1